MKLFIVSFILLFALTSCQSAPSTYTKQNVSTSVAQKEQETELPNSLFIKEKFSFTTKFSIVNENGTDIGWTFKKDVLNLRNTVRLYDNLGTLRYVAQESLVSFGNEVIIYDGNNNKIGTIMEKLFTSFFKTYSTYEIFDKNDRLMGVSNKDEFFNTEFNLYSNGNPIANIRRPAFNFLDSWGVKIQDEVVEK